MKDIKIDQEAIERAVKLAQENFGSPQDMWHPDYGWILKDGELTQEGADFLEKEYKPYLEKK